MSGDKLPATTAQNKAAANCNFVSSDRIWKDHVNHEQFASKTWPQNWGFLTTRYTDLVRDDFPPPDIQTKREIPTSLQFKPVTPISEYIKVEPSPQPVPNTTSKQIGWRSTDRSLALERYGRYTKPKGALLKQLNWPNEAIG